MITTEEISNLEDEEAFEICIKVTLRSRRGKYHVMCYMPWGKIIDNEYQHPDDARDAMMNGLNGCVNGIRNTKKQ